MVTSPGNSSKSQIKPRIFHQKKVDLQDALPLDTPFSVHIDVCSLCNFKCTFCFQNDKEGMKESGVKWGMMEVDTFKKCVDDLKKFPNKIKKIKIGKNFCRKLPKINLSPNGPLILIKSILFGSNPKMSFPKTI